MSHSRSRQLSLQVCYAFWLAALSACATGVQQELVNDEASSSTGKNTGGASMAPSEAGSSSVVPTAGSTGSGGGNSPFGGSASTGGKSSAGSGGMADAEGGAPDPGGSGGSGGSGGAAGGSGGGGGAGGGGAGGGGGSASGSCACGKTLAWVDNTSINWTTGDCLTVTTATGTTTYEYTGAMAQTYANGDCNPGQQAMWCTNLGSDYKFVLCP